MPRRPRIDRGQSVRVLLGFAAFGVFWGAWGAALPAVQVQAHIGDGAFGGVLLLIGAGAMTSMRLTGLLLDRFGRAVAPVVVTAFAACAVAAGSAASAATLGVALFALGALSGAFDVVINTAAVGYESVSGRPLVGAAHAAFSAAVVAASALTGLARSAGAGPRAVFIAVGVMLCVAAVATRDIGSSRSVPLPSPRRWRVPRRLVVFGAMCALAYLVENAQQSWSARNLEVGLHAPPHISGLGPSVFALATVAARLASQSLARRRVSPRLTLAGGALLAAAGTAVTALAPSVGLCLAGVAVAGLGTGVCAPTIISTAGAGVPAGQRGATVSTVMTIAYLGFAAGPAVVGLVADRLGLQAALGVVAGIAAVLAASAAGIPTTPAAEVSARRPGL